MTTQLPHQAPPVDELPGLPEPRGRVIRRRALTLLIIVLLIGVPAGYLVISAAQSRDSGRVKEEKYSARGLTPRWPSKVQRRLYQVPMPHPSGKVAHYETNNWKTSRLYVQFQTPSANLDVFLKDMGASRSELTRDKITIGERDQTVTKWDFSTPGPWYGLVHEQRNPRPTQQVMVSMADPDNPFIYVVSRVIP